MAVLRPLKVVLENYPEGQDEDLRGDQQPRGPGRRHAPRAVRPRALHRARRLHGGPAEEVLPARARARGAAALRLLRHLPRGGQGRRRRGGRAALHLRPRHPRRRRARRPQGEGARSTGCRRPTPCRPRCGCTTTCSRRPSPGADGDFRDDLNPARSRFCDRCRLEPALAEAAPGEPVQFERLGYFAVDPDSGPAGWCSTARSHCATAGPRCRPEAAR